jgi:uncharacterized membrane protein YhaH (DUF805 family)
MRIFRNALDFSGKANRAEFLRAIVYAILFVLAGAWLDETYVAPARGFLPGEEGAGNPTALLFAAIAAIPLSSTTARFMHKVGVSGWWALPVLVIPALVFAWWYGMLDPYYWGYYPEQ